MNVTSLEPCAIYSLTAMIMNNIRATSFWGRDWGGLYTLVDRFCAKVSEGLANFMFLSCCLSLFSFFSFIRPFFLALLLPFQYLFRPLDCYFLNSGI